MRKMMTKEVTFSVVKSATIEVQPDGTPVAVTLPDETFLGTITQLKAQKALQEKHNTVVTITSNESYTQTYEMAVEDFIKYATVKKGETE